MTPLERVLKAVKLKEPDRVPIGPYMAFFQGAICEFKTKDILFDPTKIEKCSRLVFEKYGGFDIYHIGDGIVTSLVPTLWSIFYQNWKLPGVDLPDDALPQLLERNIDEKFYHLVAENGIKQFRLRNKKDIKNRYGVNIDRYYATYNKIIERGKEWAENKRVMTIGLGSAIGHPIDILSYMRGVRNWLVDCVYKIDEVGAAAERIYESLLNEYRKSLRRIKKTEKVHVSAFMGSHRTSASFISPKQFEKIGLPFFKRSLNELLKNYHVIYFHLDGNWIPFLGYFREFPKARCILHFDHQTDLVEAKKVIGDRCCLMGNVDPALLSTGTANEVEKRCKFLIERCKEGGGLILSSSCEVPHKTPFENVMAMKNAVIKYGSYR